MDFSAPDVQEPGDAGNWTDPGAKTPDARSGFNAPSGDAGGRQTRGLRTSAALLNTGTPLMNAVSSVDFRSSMARLAYDADLDAFSAPSESRLPLNSKLGASAAFVSIPPKAFEEAKSSPANYQYVYSKAGARPGFGPDRGFEQWAMLKAGGAVPKLVVTATVPETSTWVGGAAVAALMGGVIWRRRASSAK